MTGRTVGAVREGRPRAGAERPAWAGPLGLYRAGDTWLHRLGPGPKTAGLAALGIAVAVLTGLPATLGLLGIAAGVAASARLPVRSTARALLPVLVTALVVGAYQVWQRGPVVGIEVAADLVTLVLAATTLTATTRADRMLDALTRALRPLRHLGVAPQTVALAVGLMLRAVPALVHTAGEVRDAARARGLERNVRALLVPTAIRAVGRARSTGEALTARGLGD
ncbi:energy-coupling factor transporter transmembrane protein EcfT [Cellulomonas sp. KRMCY2]|uniref:energy-coupling factor transporter transmembrane component T family protein n=1 Tax=Cellulomonas sp. KRMCY2 TaxID=1304865 RepID=UPI00045E91B7|nr:energy-coupling factor transporter transmembrane protein EcfT [Cellulomonas sp. KRMCY2]